MAKQNYRYEIVFRTVYLDEECEEVGTETEAVLFSEVSGNVLYVDNSIEYFERHCNGTTRFNMDFRLPKEGEENRESEWVF